MTDTPDPLEDEHELISAINREGIFFRKAVMTKFEKFNWKCNAEYPYSLQKYIEEKGISRSADIYTKRPFGNPDNVEVNLIIECKKSYAPRSKWIFFKHKDDGLNAWEIHIPTEGVNLDLFSRFSNVKFPICYDQIVLKPIDNKQKLKTKGQKVETQLLRGNTTQIYQASAEVSNALFGIKSNKSDIYNDVESDLWRHFFRYLFSHNWFIPIVITNAELNISEFEITKDTIKTGAIDDKKFKLNSVPWLVFEYPLPYYLQLPEDPDPTDTSPINSASYIRKLPIIFLNSMEIEKFLKIIYNSAAPLLYSTGRIK
jgi:hypothetical protein